MNLFRAIAVALAALLAVSPVAAQWQTPDHSVPVGRGGGALGFKSAAPGTAGFPLVSNNAASDPTFQALPNAGLAPGAANTVKGSLNGSTTSDIAITACTLTYQITKWVAGTGWQCGLNPVLPSRAVATTLDLSAFNSVTTQGYLRPGDGGGAKFYKRNGAILTFTITVGGSCNNGTWPGIRLTGGTGTGAYGTLVVSGGVATGFTIQGTDAQGIGYTALDALTVSNAGNVSCTTFPVIRVDTVGNAPFLDASVTALNVTVAGAGCTNASYVGRTPQNTVPSGGGLGDRLMLNVDVVGGAVVGTSIATPGGGYRVGDQLSFLNPNGTGQIPGCTTEPKLQISGVSTPRGSFSDAAASSNNWQIIYDTNLNVMQFGAIANFNWLSNDADAVDSGPAFRSALEFVALGNGPADAHGFGGGRLNVPKGGYLICGGATQYEYTTLQGAAFGGSMLKQCNSDGATASLIYQGSPTARVGNFAIQTWDLTLYGAATGTGPIVYSNNNQSGDAILRVAMYPNVTNRTCLKYEIGYGGQSMYGIHSAICVAVSGSPAFDLSGNFGFQIDGQTMIATVSSVAIGVRFGDGGIGYIAPGVHCEGAVTNCFSVNGSGTSPPLVTIMGALGPATNLIQIETGTPANRVTVINTRANGSGCVVYRQATATCALVGDQLGLATY